MIGKGEGEGQRAGKTEWGRGDEREDRGRK
jgi:hypothetical protein